MARLQVVSDKLGRIVASGPAKVNKSEDGPTGAAMKSVGDQYVYEVDLPKDAADLSPQQLFASFKIVQKTDAALVDKRPGSKEQK